jgi:hypothetical protein
VQQRTTRLLVDHRLLEEREPGAAVVLGDARAGPAELGERLPARLRRRLEEAARLGAELVLEVREGEIH